MFFSRFTSLINREKLCVNREKDRHQKSTIFSSLVFHRLRPVELLRFSPLGRIGIVQKVFSEKASTIARMRQKCIRNASKMRQNGSKCFIGKRGIIPKCVRNASNLRQKCIKNPWKLKPGFINRVLVALIFEASKCL